MRKILAQPHRSLGPRPSNEPWLMAQTLVDSQGREYLVQELLDQCRRNYHSTMLKKKPRLAIHNWSQADMQWIVENKPEVVQYRFGIDHQQAIYLQYRCRTRLRSKFI